VIARPALLLLLVLILWLGGSTASATTEILGVEIQIRPESPPVRLAPADADAFQRRLNAPPPYVGPRPSGESVLVTSGYWDAALRADESAPHFDAAATYFIEDGVVQARQAGRDLFFVLDHRQRAMLARYVRLARTGSISSNPGALQVLIAAANSETISIEPGGVPLTVDDIGALWRALDDQKPVVSFIDEPQPPARAGGYWVTFTTAEGRALQYHYDPATGTLTDFLRTETYTIRNLLPSTAGEPPQIEQQEPRGSLLWWPVMLGGSVALLAAAVWFRRLDASRR
jgi:hypothetical protein